MRDYDTYLLQYTGSPKAKMILENWDEYLPKFWQIVPPAEAKSPEASVAAPAEAVVRA